MRDFEPDEVWNRAWLERRNAGGPVPTPPDFDLFLAIRESARNNIFYDAKAVLRDARMTLLAKTAPHASGALVWPPPRQIPPELVFDFLKIVFLELGIQSSVTVSSAAELLLLLTRRRISRDARNLAWGELLTEQLIQWDVSNAPPVPDPDILHSGETLSLGEWRVSKQGRAVLLMADDGNLVLFEQRDKAHGGNRLLWSPGTGPNRGANRADMQTDGNFVVYAGDTPLWASDTSGNPGAHLAVQDDGNVAVYQGTELLWQTDTSGFKVYQDHSWFVCWACIAWNWLTSEIATTEAGQAFGQSFIPRPDESGSGGNVGQGWIFGSTNISIGLGYNSEWSNSLRYPNQSDPRPAGIWVQNEDGTSEFVPESQISQGGSGMNQGGSPFYEGGGPPLQPNEDNWLASNDGGPSGVRSENGEIVYDRSENGEIVYDPPVTSGYGTVPGDSGFPPTDTTTVTTDTSGVDPQVSSPGTPPGWDSLGGALGIPRSAIPAPPEPPPLPGPNPGYYATPTLPGGSRSSYPSIGSPTIPWVPPTAGSQGTVAAKYKTAIDEIQALLNTRDPTLKQLAVEKAAEVWGLLAFKNQNVQRVTVTYNELDPKRDADTDWNPETLTALITIGPWGLQLHGEGPYDAKWLVSTMYHESIHVINQAGKVVQLGNVRASNYARNNTPGENVNEFEAYYRELQMATSLGLNSAEIADIKAGMKRYRDALINDKSWKAQVYLRHIGQGNFTIDPSDILYPKK
jgi:hypothetical protein